MTEIKLVADTLLAAGSVIGLACKLYALKDSSTVWSRKSSGLNIATYPVTALFPMYLLGLWFSLSVSVLNFLTWIGIFLYRSPSNKE